ncbi:MAG: flagellar biosynthesis protein FliQ [Bacillota bacterium]
MASSVALELVQKSLMMILLLAAPPLLISLVVGLVISILQATTQIQDQMIQFVPKIIAVLLGLLLFAPWYVNVMLRFTGDILLRMADVRAW